MNQRTRIISHIKRKYHVMPEYLWAKSPEFAVFRHDTNRKWFAIIMNVPYQVLGLPGDGNVDIINVKCESGLMGALLGARGYRPAYHMSKAHWITAILDDTIDIAEIFNLIDLSYKLTAGK